jgi:light-regulated signal transduction histidine kinase (bacteriophytochrome)
MNESLEVAVQHRTSALEKQNKQLSEYAFINSHMLRAPLSRILGLTYILSKEKLNIKDSKLLNALTIASEDLDGIVRKISSLLYKREDFTRNDINDIIERNFKKKTVK